VGGNGERTAVLREDSMGVYRRDEERSNDKEKQMQEQ